MKKTILKSVGLIALGCGCTHAETIINADITRDTTWTSAGNPYIIDSFRTCSVGEEDREVTLTIEAGTEVVFRTADTLAFQRGAALVVNGTENDPVTFRTHATDGIRRWQIAFGGAETDSGSRNEDCVITHAILEQGSVSTTNPMVKIQNSPNPVTFRHCTFRNTSGKGLEVHDGCAAKVEDCEFRNLSMAAVWYRNPSADQTRNYIHNSRFEQQDSLDNPAVRVLLHNSGAVPGLSGNTGDDDTFILVEPLSGTGNVDLEFPSMTWQLPGRRDNTKPIPYVMDVPLEYGSPEGQISVLTINAGNVIEMHDAGFWIERDAVIRIAGTEQDPILFTKSELWDDPDPRWRTIEIRDDAQASSCVVKHAIFEYGGDGEEGMIDFENQRLANNFAVGNCEFRHGESAGVYINHGNSEHASSVTIRDCVFHDNAEEDIYFHGGHKDDPESRIENCRFSNAADDTTAAIRFVTCRMLISGISGDNETFILLDDPIGEVDEDLRLTYPGALDDGSPVPYFLSDRWTISAADGIPEVKLTIDPGCVIRCQRFPQTFGPHIAAGTNAAIVANGTAAAPILFGVTDRWHEDNATWNGVDIHDDADGARSSFRHVIMEGSDPAIETDCPEILTISDSTFRNGSEGLWVKTDARAVIRNCRFENHDGSGLVIGNHSHGAGPPASVSVVDCVFVDNENGIRYRYPEEGATVSACTFQDNREFGIRNDREISVDARDCDWGDVSGPLDDSDAEDTNYQLGFMYHNPDGLGDSVSDDVVYAPWIGLQRMVSLTIRVSQCDIGGTWPMVGTHQVPFGTPVSIVAVPVTGASFDGWTVLSGVGHIADPASQETTVTLQGDCIIEATLSGQATCFNEKFDAWAGENGLSPVEGGFFDPQRDSSGNGVADVVAFAMGFDPKSGESPNIGVRPAGNTIKVTYPEALEAQPYLDFVVEGSANLDSFEPVSADDLEKVRTRAGEVDVVAANVSDTNLRFFRIRVEY